MSALPRRAWQEQGGSWSRRKSERVGSTGAIIRDGFLGHCAGRNDSRIDLVKIRKWGNETYRCGCGHRGTCILEKYRLVCDLVLSYVLWVCKFTLEHERGTATWVHV